MQSIRIVTLGQGRGTVGIEVPNSTREIVSMLSVVKSVKFQDCQYRLPIVLGKTIYNEIYIGDLTKMPHLLVAGATGQGKSVGLNAIIASLLYKKHPAEPEVRPHRPETGGACRHTPNSTGTSSPKWRARRAPSSPTRARR